MSQNLEYSSIRVLRRKDVEFLTGLSKSSIYSKQDSKSKSFDSTFPHSIKLGGSAVGWIEKEIHLWLENRVLLSRGES